MDRYPDHESTETGKARGPGREDTDRAVRRKDRPARPPPPQSPTEREKGWDRKHDRGRDLERERHMEKEQRRDREQDLRGTRGRDRERSRDGGLSGDGQRERDRQKQKDKDRQQARSRDRGLEEEPGHSRNGPRESRASWEEGGGDVEREGKALGRPRVHSGPEEVFDELELQGGGHSHPNGETGTLSPLLCSGGGCLCGVLEFLFCFGNLRWWVDLTMQSLMKTLISCSHEEDDSRVISDD